MRKKKVLILLSILHICVFCIGILIMFRNAERTHTGILPDSDVRLAGNEPETEPEVETLTETLIEIPSENEAQIKTQITAQSESPTEPPTESEPETPIESPPEPAYTFRYVGGTRNLNIRKGPSMQYEIIGKIPPNMGGRVIELTDSDWALVEYRGTTGYSSLRWITLTPIEAETD